MVIPSEFQTPTPAQDSKLSFVTLGQHGVSQLEAPINNPQKLPALTLYLQKLTVQAYC